MRRSKNRLVRDKQIIVRATSEEMDLWFTAAERVAEREEGRAVSLSRCVRILLNDWAKRVSAVGIDASAGQMAAIRGRNFNDHAQHMQRVGVRFSHPQVEELGEELMAWVCNRLGLVLVRDHAGVSALPPDQALKAEEEARNEG